MTLLTARAVSNAIEGQLGFSEAAVTPTMFTACVAVYPRRFRRVPSLRVSARTRARVCVPECAPVNAWHPAVYSHFPL